MFRFNTSNRYANNTKHNDLSYKTILRIAEMRLVQKIKPVEIARILDVSYNSVIKICSAQKQNNLWINAIAELGRKDLIQ